MVHCIYSGVTGNSFQMILNFYLLRFILSWLINSADPGEILQNHLGLQCLQNTHLVTINVLLYAYGLMLAHDKALHVQIQELRKLLMESVVENFLMELRTTNLKTSVD